MKTRVITATIAMALFIPIVLLGGWPLRCLVAILALMGIAELARMKRLLMVSGEAIIASIAVLMVVCQDLYTHSEFLSTMAFPFVVGLFLMLRMIVTKNSFNFDDAGVLFLGVIYIGYGFYSFYQIREASLALLMFGLLIVWITDSGAYMIGRKIGKNKLAPKISPNKTWEGSIGGTVSAIVIVTALFSIFNWLPNYSILELIIISLVLSVAGQFGDLIESSYKRLYGVKDSGNVLPGHGGILDRFDSMLIVMPILFMIYTYTN